MGLYLKCSVPPTTGGVVFVPGSGVGIFESSTILLISGGGSALICVHSKIAEGVTKTSKT